MATLKQLYGLFALVAIANLLMLIGFGVYLGASGKLNANRLEKIAAILRGGQLKPAVTRAVSMPASVSVAVSQPTVTAVKNKVTLEQQLGSMEILQREKRMLADVLVRVKDGQARVVEDRQRFEARREQFQQQVQQHDKTTAEQGVSKLLALYSSMASRQVKEDFMNMDVDIVAWHLKQMPERTARKILNEFRTSREQARRREILDKMRMKDTQLQSEQG